MALDGIGQRLQQGGGLADPIGKGRAVEIDTFALEDLRLAIKRKMVRVLVDQHMCEQPRPRSPLLDRARRQRRLADRLAAATRHARADDPVHDKATRDVFQFLGDILAECLQNAATGAAL